MPHRAHLFSLRVAHAFRESCFYEPYTLVRLRKDLIAGVTVGIIAIPLAMALAIASGVPPQYGLYTAAIGGFIIALTGGSRFSVSGPTAAFVVILYPIAHAYGLGGLLIATMMAGVILVCMALLRIGRFIEYIPESVTLGFTSGIAIVIVTLQIKDFLGLPIVAMPEAYWKKIDLLIYTLPSVHWPSTLVAALTLCVLIVWPRLKTAVPPHLPAVIIGSCAAAIMNYFGSDIDTIATRFSYTLADGSVAHGIPAILPGFEWPWKQSGPDGTPLQLSWTMMRDLLPAAFAIAMLGAIESLLCAVVLDGVTGKRHSSNSELLGQGIGNILTPFFGGITATAALARSAANFRAGAESPVASMIHSVTIFLSLITLTALLNYLPMPVMAALLMVVAWNMSEAPKSLHLLTHTQNHDRWVFLTCFSLTILFDMVIAITAGVVLAAMLFVKDIADMTRLVEISDNKQYLPEPLTKRVRVFKVTGPLFFAAADKIFSELTLYATPETTIILYLDNVNILDSGGLAALTKLIAHCKKVGAQLVLTDVQFQPLKTMAKAKISPIAGVFRLYPSLREASDAVKISAPENNAI